uniref:Transmembrane protein n=1 Tax=Medicago truncatula TaxID=3880 RepID=A2Q1G9_MEDTR|nr:hypothetical protein MtrDRAFT_AC148816g44v2 [Medicago truncatula]
MLKLTKHQVEIRSRTKQTTIMKTKTRYEVILVLRLLVVTYGGVFVKCVLKEIGTNQQG